MGELDDVMTLLAISILADGRVAAEEVNVFTAAVTKVRLSDADIALPSEEDTIAWFEKYRFDIRSIISGPRAAYEDRLKALLDNLSAHVRPDTLLHILQMISAADGEVHESESRLMSFIRHHWQMD